MTSIYTKSTLNKINRENSFEYRLARNIAVKYGVVYAVAWDCLDEKGNQVAVGSQFKTFFESEICELKSFIQWCYDGGINMSFAKCFDNLPCKSWV